MPLVQMPDGTPVMMPDKLDDETAGRLRVFQAMGPKAPAEQPGLLSRGIEAVHQSPVGAGIEAVGGGLSNAGVKALSGYAGLAGAALPGPPGQGEAWRNAASSAR